MLAGQFQDRLPPRCSQRHPRGILKVGDGVQQPGRLAFALEQCQLLRQGLDDDAVVVNRHRAKVNAVIAKDVERVVVSGRFDQHDAVVSGVQPGDHVYGLHRASDEHQVIAGQAQPFLTVQLFDQVIYQRWRALFRAVLQRQASLWAAQHRFGGGSQTVHRQCCWIRVTKDQRNGTG